MMNQYLLVLNCIVLLTLSACSTNSLQLKKQTVFLPISEQSVKSIAHKYYIHFTDKKDNVVATNIEYRLFKLVSDQHLKVEYFDPAFRMSQSRSYSFDLDKLLSESEERYLLNGDTIQYTINESAYIDLKSEKKKYEKTDGVRTWKRIQESLRDTTIMKRPAKVVTGIQVISKKNEGVDTVLSKSEYQEIYAEGIGLLDAKLESEKDIYHIELVEQIPTNEFQKLADHNLKRVGYVDSTKCLFKQPDFKTCATGIRIFDYYNGEPQAEYKYGKYVLRKHLLQKINKELLANESGYLTYRFVINCEGAAGWFTPEMIDLDFQHKVFNTDLVNHLGKLLMELEEWQATVWKGKAFDSYAYLTFKLEDGKIIEILP